MCIGRGRGQHAGAVDDRAKHAHAQPARDKPTGTDHAGAKSADAEHARSYDDRTQRAGAYHYRAKHAGTERPLPALARRASAASKHAVLRTGPGHGGSSMAGATPSPGFWGYQRWGRTLTSQRPRWFASKMVRAQTMRTVMRPIRSAGSGCVRHDATRRRSD
jgi:hypothetical protein